jgi:Fe-S cluster assembly protein SufD
MANPELHISKDNVVALSQALSDPPWYAAHRLAAWEVFEGTPMPSLNDDPWRRTNLAGFKWAATVLPSQAVLLAPSDGHGASARIPAALTKPLTGKTVGGQLVWSGGKTASYHLDPALQAQNVIFTDFLAAARQYPDLAQKYLSTAVKAREGKFAALAETLVDGGLFVYVPRNVQVTLPLHFVAWLTGPAHFNRIVIAVDEGATVTVVQEWASPKSKTPALHAATVEALVGANAHLTLVELQSLGRNVWNFVHERVRAAPDATVDWVTAAIGSRLTKDFSEVNLEGMGATAKMSGFYFADENQHFDYDTQQNHMVPHTTSDLLFKGAVKDQSHSVWQGMIYVAPGAQKTDGYQANRNLVLSKTARADALPGLEILNDDVRCSHGATVGQMEEDHIFYLMSRGLPRAEAEKLAVSGFFEPVMDRIPFEGVRQRLRKAIEEKMK